MSPCLVSCSCFCSVLPSYVVTSLWEEGADGLASRLVVCSGYMLVDVPVPSLLLSASERLRS